MVMSDKVKGALIYILGTLTAATIVLFSVKALGDENSLIDEINEELATWEEETFCNEEELLEASTAYDTLHMTWRDCTGYTEGQQAERCEEWYAGWVEYNEVFHYRMSTCDQN